MSIDFSKLSPGELNEKLKQFGKLSPGEWFEEVKQFFKGSKKELGKVNIILAGKTGVGKSSLLNAVFKEDLAATGVGQPITQEVKEYYKEEGFYHLFDTKGFEVGRYEEIKNDILGTINDRANNSEDPNEHFHIMWYCINDNGKRIEPEEIKFIKSISEKIPVVVVLTQSFKTKDDEFFKEVEKELFDVSKVKVVRVLALDVEIDYNYCVKAYGVEELVEIVHKLLPECAKAAFAAAQQVSKRLRKEEADKIINLAAVAAGTAAATPIPFSDCFLIAPIQIGMMAKISNLFKLSLSGSFIQSVVTPVLASLLGRSLFGTLIKLIPGLGSLVGGVISAGVAWTITETIGHAYYKVLEELCDEDGNLSDVSKEDLKKKLEDEIKCKLISPPRCTV